jgi:NADPH:quinone reductase-like Zn-dependent oxidoreductase
MEYEVHMISTEAWVLYAGPINAPPGQPGEFKREEFCFADIAEDEVLAEPLYGCWESNMSHAITRNPIDVCRYRRESRIVLGNAGIVRIKRTGRNVTVGREGDLAILAPIGSVDQFGYAKKIMAFDAPNTMGLLAKQMKLHERQLAVVPPNSRHSVKQCAAFALRYATAWANWKVAYGCWRLQMPESFMPTPYVCSWGGGVGLAEVTLAKYFGCRVSMMASTDERLKLLTKLGIEPIDRRRFLNLAYDEEKYESDRPYRREYLANEAAFLQAIRAWTEETGVCILIDNIGKPVFRASLKALGRQGVLATAGWKHGMDLRVARAAECINRHIHVFTHGASYLEGIAALKFAEETGWMPPSEGDVYTWDKIGQLAQDFQCSKVKSYFPLFEVTPPETP